MRKFLKCYQAKSRIVIEHSTIITLAVVSREVAIYIFQIALEKNSSNYFNNSCYDLLLCTEPDANLDTKHWYCYSEVV